MGFFPAQPPSTIGGTGGSFSDSSATYSYGGRCNGNYSWSTGGKSYSAPYIGWTWQVSGELVQAYSGQDLHQVVSTVILVTSGGYSCIPPPEYQDTDVVCAVRGTGTLYGPGTDTNWAGWKPTYYPDQTTAFERGGESNPALCDTSYAFPYNATPSALGRYYLVGHAQQVRCTRRVFITKDARTGGVPAPKIINCGAPYNADTEHVIFEMVCKAPYLRSGWSSGLTYTTDDCQGSEWKCNASAAPTFAGAPNGSPVAVLDDGKGRNAVWKQPQPSGQVRRVRNKAVLLHLLSGSPFRLGQPLNGNTQPYQTSPLNEVLQGGWAAASGTAGKTAFGVAFMGPGVPGHPWTARPEWHFKADFAYHSANLIWDMASNSITWTLNTVWVPDVATCRGVPMQVNANRARNSSK